MLRTIPIDTHPLSKSVERFFRWLLVLAAPSLGEAEESKFRFLHVRRPEENHHGHVAAR